MQTATKEQNKQTIARGKQMEFSEFPERTPLGQKIIEFVEAKNQLENKKNVFDRVKEELAGEFRKAKREAGIHRIQVGKTVVLYEHTEKDVIKILKAEAR